MKKKTEIKPEILIDDAGIIETLAGVSDYHLRDELSASFDALLQAELSDLESAGRQFELLFKLSLATAHNKQARDAINTACRVLESYTKTKLAAYTVETPKEIERKLIKKVKNIFDTIKLALSESARTELEALLYEEFEENSENSG